jgi:shikimate 5-dehydrogenase
MAPFDFQPAARPTFYFVGVTTGQSSIMQVFPEWAKYLELGDCPIRGIDCKHHDEPEVYRRVVEFLKNDEHSLGGLVTTHKLDLLNACRDMFDGLDPYAELLDEVSSISKRGAELWGHAKDPITSGLSLEAFLPENHWRETGGELCLLGAGGSSLALTTYLIRTCSADNRPAKIYVTNRSPQRLEHMRRIHEGMDCPIPHEYILCPTAGENDRVVNRLAPSSLVVNATGLGKDAPGSPITAAAFPEHGLAWEFNYRGDLIFLDQANAQKEAKNLIIEDGWVYFIHGWTRVIAEVFHRDIPTSGPAFDELCRIAAAVRK